MGKGSVVPFFRFHSQKPTSKRSFSKCVSGDYPCFDYHCRETIQRRQDTVSSTGPEVLFGRKQRPERVSIPTSDPLLSLLSYVSLSLENSQHIYKYFLKDLTWSNNDNNMYLGPVVAAQQVLDPSPPTSHPRKEKKGGGGGTSAAAKSSGV